MKKVIVGMSGGVDSSVAAILLMEQGYEVEGLFMRNWDSLVNNDILGNPNLSNDICPQEMDYNDALSVCNTLGIKLHRIDFVKEYYDYVFTYFLEELKLGRTPNPDIMCNKFIKFDLFVKEAKRLGADAVATGHYARTKNNKLYKAKDLNKDQSYFLAGVSSNQLENILFPLGEIEKPKVREIAAKYNLITASKKDSTGICFIGERNFKSFLENYLPNQDGDIVDIDTNKILGRHHGLMYYTIGQRRGIGISGKDDKCYVVGKDVNKNILYVSLGSDTKYLVSTSCIIDNLNFISDKRPASCCAKFRYRQPDIKVELEYLNNFEILVKYNNVKSVTPGQACVLYLDDECLGMGIINSVKKNSKDLWYL